MGSAFHLLSRSYSLLFTLLLYYKANTYYHSTITFLYVLLFFFARLLLFFSFFLVGDLLQVALVVYCLSPVHVYGVVVSFTFCYLEGPGVGSQELIPC